MHGEEKWPLQRGFERFYGILAGACSYLRPSGGRGLTLDNTKLPEPEAPYYTTDAFTDYAIRFVDEQKDDKPFFLYLAFNAPHWPLQAKEEDIQKQYRFTRCCDEVFLQTLLYNSSYSLNMYFDEDSKRYYNMRYVDFQRGNPYVFRIDDKGLLNSRKEIFARKFDYVIDKDIIFNLRDRITN